MSKWRVKFRIPNIVSQAPLHLLLFFAMASSLNLSGQDTIKVTKKNPLIGTWIRTKYIEDGEEMPVKNIALSILIFKANKAYTWKSFRLFEHGKWTLNASKDTVQLSDVMLNRNDMCCITYVMSVSFPDQKNMLLQKWYYEQGTKHVSAMYFTRKEE